eukprot:2230682-Rhodomonas_salina.1
MATKPERSTQAACMKTPQRSKRDERSAFWEDSLSVCRCVFWTTSGRDEGRGGARTSMRCAMRRSSMRRSL